MSNFKIPLHVDVATYSMSDLVCITYRIKKTFCLQSSALYKNVLLNFALQKKRKKKYKTWQH